MDNDRNVFVKIEHRPTGLTSDAFTHLNLIIRIDFLKFRTSYPEQIPRIT